MTTKGRITSGLLATALAATACVARPVATPAPDARTDIDPLAAATHGIVLASQAGVIRSPVERIIQYPDGRVEPDTSRGCLPPDAPQALVPVAMTAHTMAGGGETAYPAHVYVVDRCDALHLLWRRRARALADSQSPPAARARELTRLGLWDEAGKVIARARSAGSATPALVAAEAELLRRRHRYLDAESVVAEGLSAYPADRDLLLARGQLEIDRWTLDAAGATAHGLIEADPDDPAALLLLGRVQLLAKRFDDALATARRVQSLAPADAGGFLLEADVHFWKEDLAAVDTPLVAALERDPLDPDARFALGYATWRRVDARLLPQMASDWNLALAVDPLHYFTHWHFGNGHTHLTYADYAHPSDSLARERLKRADSLIAQGRPLDAVALSREIEREFPGNELPAMLRGSAFYMAYDMEREARLDSAQATFAGILARKPNYGPAHNGLAAIIKQRQFTVLAAFDSLERAIAAEPLPPDPAFDSVFADLRYYPGDRVPKMARQQLGPSVAYLPMLARQGSRFMVPPLHHDLAQAMKRPFFRGATTFDNRQWMDIRGVGSGAAGIEYVERGSHWERNVLNHEYVHLFHGRAFTDAESRRVRALYWDAKEHGRTLDYYASNNESEFLAQAYEAYLSPVKAHPLNHKAMNTRDDLARKDPATYAFVDSLARRQRAYMAGDTAVFRSNWSQSYANLADSLRSLHLSDSARSARASDSLRVATLAGDARRALADSVARRADSTRIELAKAAAFLDTALVWDDRYVPAILSWAALRREERRFDDAERWIARALEVDSSYAPTWADRATLVARRAAFTGDTSRAVFEEQARYLERALSLETDLAIRASLSGSLRRLYLAHSRLPDALRVADDYVKDAPMVSTYLRDRRDESAAFAAALRAEAGQGERALVFFDSLVPLKPQNWGLRDQQVRALWAAGLADSAL
ncbi:MAG TPA: hypothetical protein VGE02_07260, partial [Gemmatimonadales bacterium]